MSMSSSSIVLNCDKQKPGCLSIVIFNEGTVAWQQIPYPYLEAPPSCIVVLLLQDLSWLWRGTQRGLGLPLQTLGRLAHPTHPQRNRVGLFVHLVDPNRRGQLADFKARVGPRRPSERPGLIRQANDSAATRILSHFADN